MKITTGTGIGLTHGRRKGFSPYEYSPALWLDASDQSTLVMDGAASFTVASSNYLDIAHNNTLNLGNTHFWVAGWFYPTNGSISSAIYWKYAHSANNDIRLYVFYDRTVSCNFNTTDGSTVTIVAGTWVLNQWNFVIVRNSPVNKKIYLKVNNAANWTEASYSGNIIQGDSSLIVGGLGAAKYDGRMDSWAFGRSTTWLDSNADSLSSYLYNSGAGRRSSDFINSSHYSGSGAVSWWDLDERSGTRKDRIGSNDLTDNNSVGYASGIASGNVQYDGDPIKQWSDKSGNGRHVTAPTDAARPTFKTGIQNGRSITRFDGTDDYLRITGLSAYSSPVSVSMVIIPTVPGSGSKTVFDGYGSNQHSLLITSGLVWNVRTQNSTTSENVSSYVSTTPYIITWVLNGAGNSTFSRNGTSTSLSQNHLVSSTGYTIGARADGSVPSECDIGEVIVYHVQLSTSQRLQIERYLGNKWGIAVA